MREGAPTSGHHTNEAHTPRPLEEHVKEQARSSPLYAAGLLRESFLNQHFDNASLSLLKVLVYGPASGVHTGDHTFLNYAKESIIDADTVENLIIAGAHRKDADAQARRSERLLELLFPRAEVAANMRILIEHGILTRAVFIHELSGAHEGALYRLVELPPWQLRDLVDRNILKKGTGNIITHGVDSPEYEALLANIFSKGDRTRPVAEGHPLVAKVRGFEHNEAFSKQVSTIIPEEEQGPVMEQVRTVFEHYLPRAPLSIAVKRRELIPADERARERAKHVAAVNARQEELVRGHYSHSYSNFVQRHVATYDKRARYFDIYARYGMAEMDSFALAIIAMTVDWYIKNGYARLFTGIRAVPDRPMDTGSVAENAAIPWVVLAAAPGAQLLNVRGGDFRSSHMGANRTYLTHSQSGDASGMESIPIVGLATAGNKRKLPDEGREPYVLFRADFDKKDYNRGSTKEGFFARLKKKVRHVDVAGDIPGLINETLRVLMEVEQKEIERARKHPASTAPSISEPDK